MNRLNTITMAALLLLIPIVCYSQTGNTKGLAGENLERYAILSPNKSLYSSQKGMCYTLALGITGPFDDKNLTTLDFPDEDCRAFLNAVNRQFRFQYFIKQFSMLELENTRRTFDATYAVLEELRKQPVRQGDLVFMYFSGHGLTYRNKYYFPVRNSNVKLHSMMITGGHIMEVAETLANKGASVFVFLDTCSSGSIGTEVIELKGKGKVICYPAASKEKTTLERLDIGGTVFGKELREVLSGSYLSQGGSDDLTVGYMTDIIKNTMIGGAVPIVYDPTNTDYSTQILVNNAKSIYQYNAIVDMYHLYIDAGKDALASNKYDVALARFENAIKLSENQNRIYDEDRIDISSFVKRLNYGIAEAIKPEYTNDIWRTLSQVNERSMLLDTSIVSLSRLFYGCGRYYQKQNDLENAFRFYKKAYDLGDNKDAPFELYNITASYNVPINDPIEENQRQRYLEIAASNGNKNADRLLHPIIIETPPNETEKPSIWEELFDDNMHVGVSLVSDFDKYPIGLKGDFYWGIFHVGIDANVGSSVFLNSISISIGVEYVGSGEPTVEFIGSDDEKTYGMFSYTVTPGLYYKYFSLDCGIGQLFTKTTRIDNYMYTYTTTSSSVGSTYSATTTRSTTKKEKVETNNTYFTYKPGISGLIPLDDLSILLGARYRICPKKKELNGFEFSLGFSIPIN